MRMAGGSRPKSTAPPERPFVSHQRAPMQPDYAESFDREAGCTESEWLQALPAALGDARVEWGAGECLAALPEGGALRLRWQVLAPRVIALVRLPRLQVHYAFDGVASEARQRFMRRFDLYMLRGGG